MAFPTILVNSATGSDSAASGAGPATAVTATNTVTAASSGTRFGFIGTAADLSGVAVDGSAVLFVNVASAGHRNFYSISAVKNAEQIVTGNVTNGSAIVTSTNTAGMAAGDIIQVGTAQRTILSIDSGTQFTMTTNYTDATASGVTVTNPKQVTVSQTVVSGFATSTVWAIGGKRASIGSTTSRKLFENNSGNGDAMPGWTIEMESGHAETISSTIRIRRGGDTTDGPITLKAPIGASPIPTLTFSNNGTAFISGTGNGHHLLDFKLLNSSASKTSTVAILPGSGGAFLVAKGLEIGDSTNYFRTGISANASAGWRVEACRLAYCSNVAIEAISATIAVIGNYIHNSGSHGISLSGATVGSTINWNVIAFNGGSGIYDNTGGGSQTTHALTAESNVLHGNTNDGYEAAWSLANAIRSASGLRIVNNIFSENGRYGVHFSEGTVTLAGLNYYGSRIRANGFYANTSGQITSGFSAALIDCVTLSADPYTAKGSGDFTLNDTAGGGADLKEVGFPVSLPGLSPTNYRDIGVYQSQGSGGGGSSAIFSPFASPVIRGIA